MILLKNNLSQKAQLHHKDFFRRRGYRLTDNSFRA